MLKVAVFFLLVNGVLLSQSALSDVLPYPQGVPDAVEIAKQVYFVNHFHAVNNVRYGDAKKGLILVNQSKDKHPTVLTMDRHLNNSYEEDNIRARDLAIFRSGKLRGTGILVTEYADEDRPLSFSVWLPALRKIRRHAEPDQSDSWGGSNFTYGDIYLRRPKDEQHELVGEEDFPECLNALQLTAEQQGRYTRQLPSADCSVQGRPVYKLKSTTRFEHWWYDYRLTWVDKQTFADYRSEYYKDGQLIKLIDKSWNSMGLDDPRGQYWTYWYGKKLLTGSQGQAFINPDRVKWNEDVDPLLWTAATLRKINR